MTVTERLRGEGDTKPRTIRKMTGGVAKRFSIPERGLLRKGFKADITVCPVLSIM